MRLILILLSFFTTCSCQTLYTDIPKGTTSDESITQLVLDYRKTAKKKVIGTIQNKSNRRIYDIWIKITHTQRDGSTKTERFIVPKVNPYESCPFKRITKVEDVVEMSLQIQSSHY